MYSADGVRRKTVHRVTIFRRKINAIPILTILRIPDTILNLHCVQKLHYNMYCINYIGSINEYRKMNIISVYIMFLKKNFKFP